tara:strand:- start:533 stop:1348 length:816 start_codon:yes stop_codon:yes gene_type:complete
VVRPFFLDDTVDHRVVDVSRDERHFGVGPQRSELLDQFDSTHQRHDHVGDKQLDVIDAVTLDHPKCFQAVARLDNLISLFSENVADRLWNGKLVFDKHEGFGADRQVADAIVERIEIDRVVDPQEQDVEAGPLAWRRVHGDVTALLRDDAVTGRQSQSRSFAHVFDSEERLFTRISLATSPELVMRRGFRGFMLNINRSRRVGSASGLRQRPGLCDDELGASAASLPSQRCASRGKSADQQAVKTSPQDQAVKRGNDWRKQQEWSNHATSN